MLPLEDGDAVSLLLERADAEDDVDVDAVREASAATLSLWGRVPEACGLNESAGDIEGPSDVLPETVPHELELALAERVAVPVREAVRDTAAEPLVEPVAHALGESLGDADAERLEAGERDCCTERVDVAR